METHHLHTATRTLSKFQIWVGKKEGFECTKLQQTDQKESLTRQYRWCSLTQFLIYGNIITRKVNSRTKSTKEEELKPERGLGLCAPTPRRHQPAEPLPLARPPALALCGPCTPAPGPPRGPLGGSAELKLFSQQYLGVTAFSAPILSRACARVSQKPPALQGQKTQDVGAETKRSSGEAAARTQRTCKTVPPFAQPCCF